MAIKKIKGTYDRSIKVSEAQIQKLRDAKTRDAAIKKYGADPAMQEALNRFYSKSVVDAKKKAFGIGSSVGTSSRPNGKVAKAAMPAPSTRNPRYPSLKPKGGSSGDGTGKPYPTNNAPKDRGKAVSQVTNAADIGLTAAWIATAAKKVVNKRRASTKVTGPKMSTPSAPKPKTPSTPKKTSTTKKTSVKKTSTKQSTATRTGTANKIKSQGAKITRSSATDRQPRRK